MSNDFIIERNIFFIINLTLSGSLLLLLLLLVLSYYYCYKISAYHNKIFLHLFKKEKIATLLCARYEKFQIS